MDWIPGSPLTVSFGSGIGKRSHSLAVKCSHHFCQAPIGTHCTILKYTHWGYKRETVEEFHQERIDLSKLCQCGKPSTFVCTELINDRGDPCWARICHECATPTKQGGHLCRYHQQSGVCDE